MNAISLPLQNGGVTYVDAHLLDVPLTYNSRNGRTHTLTISQLKWHRTRNRNFDYAMACNGRFSLARLVTQAPANMLVDHRHKNTLDNRLSELRICTIRENTGNMQWNRSGCASQYRGVRRSRRSDYPWEAQINYFDGVKKRCRSIGCFATEEEAARAWDEAARFYRGEFAYQNFPRTHFGEFARLNFPGVTA